MNILVVGTGFAGSIMARKFAERGDSVKVVEIRNQVGGNMYDCFDDDILVQKYGPHIINTNNIDIVNFLSKYDELIPHDCKILSFIDNKFVHLPYGYKTVQELYSINDAASIIFELEKKYPDKKRVTIYELMNSDNEIIKKFGNSLFEKGFKPYIAKQWGLDINEIDPSVVNRVQFQLSYVERYLQTHFQFLPRHGYTFLIKNILKHPNIDLSLNVDACAHLTFDEKNVYFDGLKYDKVIYTGPIDELFKYKYGHLPYRSLAFEFLKYDKFRELPCEICSYPQTEKYTRKTEYKFFSPIFFGNSHSTIVVSETPTEYIKDINVPCYPIITDANMDIYNKFVNEAKKYKNLVLVGRLATYKYYNMDKIIEETFKVFESIVD